MEEIRVIKLEDNIEYGIIDEIEINNQKYIYLTNIDDSTDFCIRKMIIENGKELLIGLNNEKEFDLALRYFSEKHQ